jgi:hypothetical protein
MRLCPSLYITPALAGQTHHHRQVASGATRPCIAQGVGSLHIRRVPPLGQSPQTLGRARLAADRYTPPEQAPAVEPAARLRFFGYRIDLGTPPPQQAVAGHGPARGGQRGRQAELRGDSARGQTGRMLRQDEEEQRPYRVRGRCEAGLRRLLPVN